MKEFSYPRMVHLGPKEGNEVLDWGRRIKTFRTHIKATRNRLVEVIFNCLLQFSFSAFAILHSNSIHRCSWSIQAHEESVARTCFAFQSIRITGFGDRLVLFQTHHGISRALGAFVSRARAACLGFRAAYFVFAGRIMTSKRLKAQLDDSPICALHRCSGPGVLVLENWSTGTQISQYPITTHVYGFAPRVRLLFFPRDQPLSASGI
jgi:hypothetical protein